MDKNAKISYFYMNVSLELLTKQEALKSLLLPTCYTVAKKKLIFKPLELILMKILKSPKTMPKES